MCCFFVFYCKGPWTSLLISMILFNDFFGESTGFCNCLLFIKQCTVRKENNSVLVVQIPSGSLIIIQPRGYFEIKPFDLLRVHTFLNFSCKFLWISPKVCAKSYRCALFFLPFWVPRKPKLVMQTPARVANSLNGTSARFFIQLLKFRNTSIFYISTDG